MKDPIGKKVYDQRQNDIVSHPEDWEDPTKTRSLSACIYALDHFENTESAAKLREKIASLPEVKDKKVILEPASHHIQYGPDENIKLLQWGLALTGLEKDKPNYLRMPVF